MSDQDDWNDAPMSLGEAPESSVMPIPDEITTLRELVGEMRDGLKLAAPHIESSWFRSGDNNDRSAGAALVSLRNLIARADKVLGK